MTKRFSSVGEIAFTVQHDCHWPHSIPLQDVRAALMRRIADIDEAEKWDEAVSLTDTVKEQ